MDVRCSVLTGPTLWMLTHKSSKLISLTLVVGMYQHVPKVTITSERNDRLTGKDGPGIQITGQDCEVVK